MRRRFVQIGAELVEVAAGFVPAPVAPFVVGDLPPYESPVTGKVIAGRAKRRDDLARNNCRPWEGIEAEKKEAARRAAYTEARSDARLDAAAQTAWYQLAPRKRRVLEHG